MTGPPVTPGDRFVGATIDRECFDSTQYSFFSDLSKEEANGALGGALEDGLEAPPEEDGLLEGEALESPIAMDDNQDYTLAGIFNPESEAEIDLDPALLEARSLPRDMFAGDDDDMQRTPVPTQRRQLYQEQQQSQQQQQQQHQTPVSKAATPMTLAELEARMAASTPVSQPSQPHQPALLSPEMRPHMQGLSPHLMQGGLRPDGYQPPPQLYYQSPQTNGLPGMHMRPPGMAMQPPGVHMQAPGIHPAHPHPGLMMHPAGSPMLQPQMMGPGGPGHHFPPGVPPGMRPMGPPAHMMPGPGMHMQHMRSPMGGPPMMAWQQHAQHHMGPPPPHMQPGMLPGDGQLQAGLSPPPMGYPPSPMMRPGFGPSPMGPGSMGSPGMFRPRFQGKLMSAQDVEHIMNILYSAVHAGVPYHEDYYYQAYVNQVTHGRNAASFKPEELRSLRPDVARLDPSASVKFAAVAGLGKIVLTNIRTPKVLMDLTSPNGAADADHPGSHAADASAAPLRPLEQEPLLAARIMVEDCHDKLLDVDDIDRCFAAAAQMQGGLPPDPAGLRARRALLATSVTAAFRLPAHPTGQEQQTEVGAAAATDGVLMNIMTLAKGRAMLARAVRVLLARPQHAPPAATLASPEHLLWALLRNAYVVFGASISDGNVKSASLMPLVESTHRLGAAAKEAIQHLSSAQQAADAMDALAVGMRARTAAATAQGASPMEAVLPLAQVRILPAPLPEGVPQDWYGDVLVTLLQRGAQLLPDTDTQAAAHANGTGEATARWHAGCAATVIAFRKHVETLAFLQQEMTRAARSDGATPAPEALAAVRALACRPLAQQLLGLMKEAAHADVLKAQLRQLL